MQPKSSSEISGDRSRSLLFLTGLKFTSFALRTALYSEWHLAHSKSAVPPWTGRGQACLRNRNLDMPASLRSVSVPSRGKRRQIGGNTASSTLGTGEGLDRIGLRPLRIHNLFSASRAILFNVLFARFGLSVFQWHPTT